MMSDIENKAGLILVGLVIFVFLLVVAFIKRTNAAKVDDPQREDSEQGMNDK